MNKLPEKTKLAPIDNGRRRLMAGAVGASAAAGLGLVSFSAQASPDVAKKTAVKPVGYHETDHIRRYYRSARQI